MQRPSPPHAAWRRFAPVLLLALAGQALAFDLVSEAEVLRDRQAPEPPFASRAVPDPLAPRIDLLAPTVGQPLRSPLDIMLRWQAQDGAVIDPASVRVRYGRLGIDVTSRVLAKATPTVSGMSATGARLPAGEHRLAIEVADSLRRIGRREFLVEIVD